MKVDDIPEQTTGAYVRQAGMFNPDNQKFDLRVFGAGSIGSFATLNLAKLGWKDISVFDFDKIEKHNIPNQFFRFSDIGKKKTTALKEIVNEFSGIEIKEVDMKITPENSHELYNHIGPGSLLILGFDSLKARQTVFDAVKGLPNYMIDCRMGGLNYSIQVVRLDDETQCKAYAESLKVQTVDLPCGHQSIIFTLSAVAAELCNIVVMINNGKDFPTIIKRNMNSYFFISDLNNGKESSEEESQEEGS